MENGGEREREGGGERGMVEVKWVVDRKSTQGVGSVEREEDEREGRIEMCRWQKHRVG